VYNNTIVMAANSRWCVNIPPSAQGQPNPAGNQIENNILYTPDSNHGSVLIYSTSVAGFISDYNVTVGRFSVDSGDSDMAVQSWQALGYDQHSIVAAPADLFVSQSGKDFHLKPGSPAIGVGAFLPEVTDDLDGNARPLATSYSIGCYEANTTVTNPVIDFTATPVHGIAPLTVNFTDETTGSPSTWGWDFGDGGKSTVQNPSHTYQSSGSYSVSLTASGTGFSGGKTRLNFITVGSPTGEFAPVSLTIVDGVLKAGDVSRVTAKDKAYLKVKSVPLGNDSGDLIQYDFQTGLNAASTTSISVVVIQHVTVAPQQEQISLFNFVSQVYDTVAVGTLTIPVDITTTVNLMNVAQYISATGEIRLQVRMGDAGKAKFKHFVDQVQITSTSGT
ncbi:MAG: PKD domain-containing protein, partial [Blastocatellia bacterium]